MRLSEYARGRDNNFLLLRLLAAFTVILYHSGSVLGVAPGWEFAFAHIGRSFGEMALDMLFVTSGFLVTASLFNRGDLNHFLWARALRLYPALWLMLPLTVFLLAPSVGALPAKDYFTAKATWDYFVKCATLAGGIRFSLPGVFDTLPLKGEFNGSLWTLPIEVRMYVYLAVGWLAFSLAPRIRVRALSLIAPAAAAVMMIGVMRAHMHGPAGNADISVFMYFCGASLYFWRDRIAINWATFAALLLLVAAASLIDKRLAFAAYLVCLPPFLLHVAYLPGGPLRHFNRLGDYSLGVYIYAFPVQQTLALAFPKLSVLGLAGLAAAISLALAFCSWNLVEKRALGLKDPCADATERVFRRSCERAWAWLGLRFRGAPALTERSAGEDAAVIRTEG